MKRIKILIYIIVISINVYAHKQDSIIFIFPDSVEQKLYEQIIRYDNYEKLNFEFYLNSLKDGKFRLTYSCSAHVHDNYWAKNTNRFILINDREYPLLFDYDSKFSTKKPSEVGRYRQREGTIERSVFIYEGYNITFDEFGRFIEESGGLYIKK